MFKNISFLKMNFSKLINYSTDVCWNGQGTTTVFDLQGAGSERTYIK
jgi:hypothetical protein